MPRALKKPTTATPQNRPVRNRTAQRMLKDINLISGRLDLLIENLEDLSWEGMDRTLNEIQDGIEDALSDAEECIDTVGDLRIDVESLSRQQAK